MNSQKLTKTCWLALALFLMSAWGSRVTAQGTTETLAATTATTASMPAADQGPSEADSKPTRTVALVGESVMRKSGRTEREADLTTAAVTELGGRILRFQNGKIPVAEMSTATQMVVKENPDIVIIFAGQGDAEAGTQDEKLQSATKKLAETFVQAGSRVYIAPSDPNLSTAVSANLRMGASQANVSYVDTGSEVAGRAYEDVFATIRRAEDNPAAILTPQPTPAAKLDALPPPADAATTSVAATVEPDATTLTATPAPKPGIFSAPTPAALETLLPGQADEEKRPSMAEETEATPAGPKRGRPEAGAGRSTVTRRGVEAEPETIEMRPPPALKPFEPQRPVPRKDVEKKAPAVSR